MTETSPKKSTTAAVIAFILAVIGGTVVVTRKPSPPPPTATVAPVVIETPPTETTASAPTVAPLVPSPSDVEQPADVGGGRVRPVRPPAHCTADEQATAARYSETPGYAYLVTHCEFIQQWRLEGGDVVVWLARHGYNSPLARCPYRFTANSSQPPENWNAVRVTRGGEIRFLQFYPGQWVEKHMEFVVEFPCTTEVMRASSQEAAFGWHVEHPIPDDARELELETPGHSEVRTVSTRPARTMTLYGFRPDVLPVVAEALPIPDLRMQGLRGRMMKE